MHVVIPGRADVPIPKFASLCGNSARRPADAARLLHELGHRRISGSSNRGATICSPTGRPSARHAGRHAAGRQADQRDQERGRDPVDVVLELPPVDLGRESSSSTGYGCTGAAGVSRRSKRSNSSRKRWNTCRRVCSAAARSSAVILRPALTLPFRLSPNCSSCARSRELLSDHPGAAPGLIGIAAVGDIEGDLLDLRAGIAQSLRRARGRSRRSRHRRRCRRCRTRRRCAGPWRPRRARPRRARSSTAARPRSARARLKPTMRVEHQGGILGGARQRPVHLARIPGERHRVVRRQPRRRPDADDAAERRRNADRAAEVGALRERQHAGRDRDRRAAGRAGRAERRIPRIAGRAEQRVDGVGAGGEFRRVGLGQHDGARGLEPAHDLGVLGRHMVLVERRAEGGADAGGQRDVLDADRQAVQRRRAARRARPPASAARAASRACVGGERDDRVELRVDPLDHGEMRVEHLDRADGARCGSARASSRADLRVRLRRPSVIASTCRTSARSGARSAGTAG